MSIWSKIFNKITFKDYPDTTTPLNATNLNAMTDAIDGLDDRVLQLLGDFASHYDNSATYSLGDYAIHDGMLYKCITAITVAEEWDSSKWQQTDCGSEFNELNSKLDNLFTGESLTGEVDLNAIYSNMERNTIKTVQLGQITGGTGLPSAYYSYSIVFMIKGINNYGMMIMLSLNNTSVMFTKLVINSNGSGDWKRTERTTDA